ncbi:MAG TPA: hypothetical protein VMT61_05100 [Candidatus Binataceae bacterium]|nr:hypothetical protein [Candidatus Binataceae bacterium]
MKWIYEALGVFTGIAVSDVLMNAEHVRDDWWRWVLGFIVFAGIATVVENAGNGSQRLLLALSGGLAKVDERVEGLERSIEELKHLLDNR